MAASGPAIPPRQQREDTERLRRLSDREANGGSQRRRSRLTTALGLVLEKSTADQATMAIASVKAWLDSWDGIRSIVAGMTAQGYDLELRQFPHGWRAAFYRPASPIRSCTALGRAVPWVAVQKAAWETLTRREPAETPSVEEESPE